MNTPAQDSSDRAAHGPAAHTLEWVTRLISLDTTSRDSNLPVIEAIADYARELGLNVNLCPADGQPEKANLLVTVPAADGTVAGGVVLSGHSDVVPVDGQDWDSDPFAPEIREGKLYGRGTCDMKGFIGVAVAALPKMAEAALTEPIHLAISFDEEVGCIGGAQIVKDIANLGLSPRACIVGEPSSMEVITAHKSINQIEVNFTGVAAHSSLTNQGVNSIEYAAKYISFVRQQADDWKAEGPFDEAYPVTYSTASVNVINGGIAGNTVPADCKVLMEFRGLPEVDSPTQIEKFRRYAEELDHQMKAEQPEAGAEFVLIASVPGLETSVDADVVSLGAQLGGEPSQGKVTYGTEAGQFSGAGIETVVCGPGDIAQAHTANEFVDLDQLGRCEDFVSQLIQLLSKD